MSIRLLRQVGLVIGLGVMLSACSSVNPPPSRLPELSFSQFAPYRLNVGRIEVVSQFQPVAQAPHIEYDMPVAPENAIKRWVQDRMQPVGRTGTLRVVIRDASAIETALKTDTGFTGMFKKEQASRIDMTADIALQMLDDRQFVIAEVSGQAAASHTTLEGQKLNDRDRLLYDMVVQLITNLNSQVDPNIQANFRQWLGAY